MNKSELIACFRDTVQLSYSMPVYKSTIEAQNSNRVYYENFVAKKFGLRCECDVIIENRMPFTVAKEYMTFGKTAVVNCANAIMPGGGIEEGLMGQEECLGRSSNLAICLNGLNVVSDFYDYQKKRGAPFYSDRIIYTKDVMVMKNDDRIPVLLEREQWFQIDVINCSAPKILKKEVSKDDARNVLKRRIKNMFEVALDHHIEVLIIGAFGCENTGYLPCTIAEVFKEVIDEQRYREYFKKIIFALFSYIQQDCAHIWRCVWNTIERKTNQNTILIGQFESKNENVSENKVETEYTGKKISILGDSISTLEGFNPEKYKVYYTGENCIYNGIHKMKDTWWGMVIERLGSELLINNSFSGSRVTKFIEREELFPSGCSDERTRGLHIGNEKPEVILIYIGTNDWANGVKPENNGTSLIGDDNYEVFRFAYETMLYKLKMNYPKSEIWCCTLCTTTIKKQPDFRFPDTYGGVSIEIYNEIIREIVPLYDCRLVDLYKFKEPYDTLDGSHPTFEGMKLLADMIMKVMTGNSTVQSEVANSKSGNLNTGIEQDGFEETTLLNLNSFSNNTQGEYWESRYPKTILLKIVSTGELVMIDEEMFVAGRHVECMLRFNREQKHLAIGRRHATFYYENGFWYLQDHSTNGTWMNEEKMQPYKKYLLKRNDMIDFAGKEKVLFFPET